MATLYADPEHRPSAREEQGSSWTRSLLDHWHVPPTEITGTSSHGTTVLGPGETGVALFRQGLRHQLQQPSSASPTRACSNSLSRQPTRQWARFIRIKTPGRARFEKIKIPVRTFCAARAASWSSKQTLRFYETNLQGAVSVDCELSL